MAFSFQSVKFYATCNVGHSCSTPNVFCFKELSFTLSVFLFCSQPCIFACIMCFVGVQILCQHALKIANVNFSWHYAKFITLMSNLVKTLNLFFYNMMSFSGHPVCHLGLIWCILLGVIFNVLLPNLWFW